MKLPGKEIVVRNIPGISRIQAGANLSKAVLAAANKAGLSLENGDILVFAHSIVSKAEGRVVHRNDIVVSQTAEKIASQNGFDPFQVQLALDESEEILREDRVLVTVMPSGLVCNFAGVDRSNAPPDSYILLPHDPDESALRIRNGIEEMLGIKLAIIISDTQGRPWRKAAINIAIGCSGINAFKYNKGRRDLWGRILKSSTVCQIDEIASAVEPLMGQAGEGTPVVLVRGYYYSEGEERAANVIRPSEENLFL